MFTVRSLEAHSASEAKVYDLPPLMGILARRSRLIAIVFCVLFFGIVGATLLTPRTYTTNVKVIVGNPGGPAPVDPTTGASSLPILNALVLASSTETPETYAALFQQTPVAQSVIDQLHLNATPTGLLTHVSVVPVTNTSLLTLSATWWSPQTSAAIANAFANAVSARERQLITDQANSAIGFLSRELPIARDQVRRTGAALARYQSSHHMAGMTAQTQSILGTLSTIESKQNEEMLSMREAQAQLNATQGQLSTTAPTITGSTAIENPGLLQMRADLSSVELRLQDALHNFTSQHPVVIGLRQQEEDLKKSIAAGGGSAVASTTLVPNPLFQQLQEQRSLEGTALQASTAAFAELARQRKALQPALRNLPSEAARYGELDRASKSAQAVYEAVEQKFNEANIARTTALSDVTVTQPATAQMAVVRPDLRLSFIIAAIIGLFIAFALAAIAEVFDRRLKDESHAEKMLSLPVLSSIPMVVGSSHEIEDLRSATVKSFLRLASAIHFAPSRVSAIAITSNGMREGRSTISLNLALAFAELGERVLLVDASRENRADSRRNGAGLYDVLLGKSALPEAVRPSRSALVDILPPGDLSSNVISVLGGNAVQDLIADARKTYRYVVIDTPPLNEDIEASLLLRSVESTIVVAKQGTSDLSQVREAIENVRGMGITTIVGVVVNGAKIDLRDKRLPQREESKEMLSVASA